MAEQTGPHVGDKGCRQPGVPSLIPYRDDRGDDAGCREHPEDHVERLEILFAERVVDQEFEAQRHDDVEQRLDHDADADEHHHLPVVLQKRLDERIDRRKRARGFLGGKDDEILIIVVVYLEVVMLGWLGRLVADRAIGRPGVRRQLFLEIRRNRIARGSRLLIVR